MSNSQRVAIITGASQGIGDGLVSGYRKLGYAVVANSRTIAESDDPMVLTVPGDVGRPGIGQRVVDAALERFGRVDTVVNNAGIFIAKPFTEYTDEDYDAVTGVNLRGFFEVSRAAVAAMLSPGRWSPRQHLHQPGRPRQLASALGVGVADEGRPQRGDQGARDRVRRPRDSGQRRRARHHPNPDARPSTYDVLAKLHPVGQMGEIDDVVDAVLYLENARFVTGEILHVDGGQSAGH